MDEHTEKMIDKAVTCTLTKLGFDMSDPIKIQEDMHFLRAFRKLSQAAGTKVIMVLVGIATLSIAGGALASIGKAIVNMLS
jgi:hypothetical protein